jgi:3-carboxy-cis,cis-muconate cycloisomerase
MSEPSPPGLFDGILARGAVREAVSDGAWVQAMLDVEGALARAQARAGLLAAEDAQAITRACDLAVFDVAALGREAAETGNPVPPLVRALSAAVAHPAGGRVHWGATSQDVLDTATMLVATRALGWLLKDLLAAADAAAGLAEVHRGSLMAGRTLLQQALPITFGLKAAGWLSGLDDAAARLEEVRRYRLAAQLGGAAGTLASLGAHGPAVLDYLAEELGLAAPRIPWHTVRTRTAELACALGEAAGALGKPGRDITLLAQTEIGEVREGVASRGGSSTLPQKHNPIAAVSAVACAMRAPGLVATLLSCMLHEHERAAGAWHAEWRPLSELLMAVGSAGAWMRDCLEHLEVDPRRMRANLDRTGGLLLAERVATALAPALGRLLAQEVVAAACTEAAATRRQLGEVLKTRREVLAHVTAADVDELLDPTGYLGSAAAFVDRALEAHAARPRKG